MPYTTKPLVYSAALLLALLPLHARAQDDSLSWSVTPYGWGSDTKLDLSVRDSEINGGVEIPFHDLLDVLDAVLQIHVEAGKGNWSSFVDLTIIETSDTIQRTLSTIDTNSDQTFIDAAVAYWPEGFGSALSLFGGVRYTELDDRFDFRLNSDPLVTRSSSEDFFDLMLGARYRFELSEQWDFLVRGDVSFGDTEGSWLVNGLFGYAIGQSGQHRILIGYQHKQLEVQKGGINSDYTLSGPIAGFNFRF